MTEPLAYAAAPLVAGVRSRFVERVNGLTLHLLEAGTPGRPLVLLLHGFPELAYSWRHQLPALAAAGFHVIAPDQRGYGRSTGWDGRYEADLAPYRLFNLAKDMLALVQRLGVGRVHAVIGHDFGSFVAATCALVRPDVFSALVMMSAPFGGPPPLVSDTPPFDMARELAALDPPREHYQHHYATPEADGPMHHPPQGLHAFLRAYYHVKSADWPGNRPAPLAALSAVELARLPAYYVMPLGATMPAAVAPDAPPPGAPCAWLPDDELAVYTAEYARNGFQGGLHWYRCIVDARQMADLQMFAGRTIDVPACYVAGSADWGIHQSPGAFERMQTTACTQWRGTHLLAGAGHWVQQEQPGATNERLLGFLDPLASPP
jgi:pimeloyl-ACP methyl ester carboxylesterase